jgi:hypothetical protein
VEALAKKKAKGKTWSSMAIMFCVLQILSVLLVAVAMSLSLAHALELPGKMRLTKDAYYAMQPIYYPGFTIGGGISEPGGTIATIALLLLTPFGSTDFWLTLVALLGLIGMQVVYWVFTHPVNKFWLTDEKLGAFGAGFFGFGGAKNEKTRPVKWTDLRDRWEYSHVARAVLAFVSLLALVIAITSRD